MFLDRRDASTTATSPISFALIRWSNELKSSRAPGRAPETPRSPSRTSILEAGQPHAATLSTRSRWTAALPVLARTCSGELCRI
jgi:hypothetical protein